MDQRFGLIGEQALLEQLATRARDAFVEGKLSGRFHGVDGGERRDQIALPLAGGIAGGGENGRDSICASPSFRSNRGCGGAADRPSSRANAMAPGQQIAIDDLIDDAGLQGVRGADGIAGAHISTAFWIPARRGRRCVPAAPGMMPSFTSGCPTCADGNGDAIMAGHGGFQPAAKRGAMDRGDDRLGGCLDAIQDGIKAGTALAGRRRR